MSLYSALLGVFLVVAFYLTFFEIYNSYGTLGSDLLDALAEWLNDLFVRK